MKFEKELKAYAAAWQRGVCPLDIEQMASDVTLNWTHVGQYHPYGDTHRICEIETSKELSEEEILLLVRNCFKLSKKEFDEKELTAGEYFRGYYTLEKTEYGYLYHAVEPYND